MTEVYETLFRWHRGESIAAISPLLSSPVNGPMQADCSPGLQLYLVEKRGSVHDCPGISQNFAQTLAG